jgi:hypothetical protein
MIDKGDSVNEQEQIERDFDRDTVESEAILVVVGLLIVVMVVAYFVTRG